MLLGSIFEVFFLCMMNDEKLSFPCVPWCVVVVPVNEASNDRATSSTLSSHHLSFHTHFFKREKYSKKIRRKFKVLPELHGAFDWTWTCHVFQPVWCCPAYPGVLCCQLSDINATIMLSQLLRRIFFMKILILRKLNVIATFGHLTW